MVLHVVDFDLFEVAAFSRINHDPGSLTWFVVLCIMSKVVKLVGYHESMNPRIPGVADKQYVVRKVA